MQLACYCSHTFHFFLIRVTLCDTILVSKCLHYTVGALGVCLQKNVAVFPPENIFLLLLLPLLLFSLLSTHRTLLQMYLFRFRYYCCSCKTDSWQKKMAYTLALFTKRRHILHVKYLIRGYTAMKASLSPHTHISKQIHRHKYN